MKKLLLLLLVTACSGGVDSLATASRGDLETSLLCGWLYKRTKNIGPTSGPGMCWLIDPPPGMSVMPPGSEPCEADEGTQTRVWASDSDIELYVTPSSDGYLNTDKMEVACP